MAPRLRARRGVALLTALLGVVVITILVTGGLFASTQEFRSGRNQLVEQRAFAVAEYGLNAEISNWDRSRNLPPPTGMAIGAADARKRYVSGRDTAFVTITRLTPTTYWVVSEGRAQIGVASVESRRRTSAYVRLAYPSVDASAAVTAAGDIDIRGASTITGVNTDPGGWGSCSDWSGGELAALRVPPGATVDYNASNLPGTIDVEEDAAAADSNTYVRYGTENWNSLVANAEIQLPGGTLGSNILPVGTATSCTASPTNWGEPLRAPSGGATPVAGCYNRFPIIYSAGNLTINANGRGQGILLVNGDLKINGNFDFYGIIIARDDIERGTGTASIHGAVFSRDANVGDNSMWAGTQDIYYSKCAVESALRGSAILTRVAERHWTQLY
ncbi:MAG TPA: pilus assembly PilX N-terminal domain-containing protein [Gemmatimonadaceae bacterium]|nr:pilus assembly PilX N-terminal domain-containing protein [Gemmatimonadaceae bacterium]